MKLCKLILVCTASFAILALNFAVINPVRADDSFDLVVNEGVIVPWEISNITPGASGAAYVDIRNAGSISGYMAVWIDGLIDTEGENPEAETGNTNEPGELSQYLTLNISGGSIAPYTSSTNFELPVALNEFPQSINYPLQLSEFTLEAGETIQLKWEWAVPPQTTNVIQGDRVSFNINYILTQNILVKKPSQTSSSIVGGNFKGEEDNYSDANPDTEPDTVAVVSSDDDTTEIYCSSDGKITITVPEKIRVISAGDEELLYIGIIPFHYIPPIPENNILLSHIYDLTTFTDTGRYNTAQLDKPVTIEIEYDTDRLPEQISSIYAASYKADTGWIKLTQVNEINQARDKITLVSTQLSAIAVFALMASDSNSGDATPLHSGNSIVSGLPDSGTPHPETGFQNISSTKDEATWETLSHASLTVAGSGTLIMIVLTYIERKRRAIQQSKAKVLDDWF